MENKNVELVKFCEFLIGLFEDEKSTVDELLDRRFEDEFIYYGFDANSYPFAEKYKINIESEA